MFDRFNEQARRVMFFSRYEAAVRSSEKIETEHVLLALAREGDPITRQLFETFGASLHDVRRRFPPPNPPPNVHTSGEKTMSEDVKRTLAHAVANERGDAVIAPHHLLLALLQLKNAYLADLGMSFEEATKRVETLVERRHRDSHVVVIRASHSALLSRLADNIDVRRPDEQQVILAILDAIAASGITGRRFPSVAHLSTAIAEALASYLGGDE